MTPEEIIDYCQAHNIKLEPTDHGTIIVDVPDRSLWSEELTQAVKTHKPEIISLLYSKSDFKGCGNLHCLFRCEYIRNLDKCPFLLNEGTYKWKGGEWKRVLH
jgi:hypothetical protein